MALWDIKSPMATAHGFEVVKPVEVFDYLDGPLTFTFRDTRENLLLANLCAVGASVSRYLVTKSSGITISDLKNGLISLRSALIRSPLWLVDVGPGGRVVNVWATSIEDLPPETIPDPDVLLTAELEEEQLADQQLAGFAKSGSDAQFAFDGGPVESHRIDAVFYGKFLQLAGDLLDQICTLIEAPAPLLQLGMTSESSYAVDVNVVERSPIAPEPAQGALATGTFFPIEKDEPKGDAGRLRQAFDVLMSLVVDAQPNPEALTLVKRLYLLRQQYGKVLELIATNAASVAVRTRTNPRPRIISGVQAGERLKVVRDLGYPYMFLELRGMLIGGLTHKSGNRETFFTIRVVDAGKKPQDFTGAVSDAVLAQLKEVALDSEVRAKVQIREEAKEQQSYSLVEIRTVDDGSPHYVR